MAEHKHTNLTTFNRNLDECRNFRGRSLQTASWPEVQKIQQQCSAEHMLGRTWEGQKGVESKKRNVFVTFLRQRSSKLKVLDSNMTPGRSSRWPALHLQNTSSTNSNNVIFPALSYQQDVTVTHRKRRVLNRLSLLRHNSSATDRREGGGCEKGSSALETRLQFLARAAEVMFWFLGHCLTVSSVWLSSCLVNHQTMIGRAALHVCFAPADLIAGSGP